MKKNIFIILITILVVLILLYLYEKKEDILNREYRDYQNNIYIDYPYFNNKIIDDYINDYLKKHINQTTDLGYLLFIDYDYEKLNDKIDLLLYIYKEKANIINKEVSKLEIDLIEETVNKQEKTIDTNLEYNLVTEQIIDTKKPMIALTFDDGPNHNTIRVLDILESYGVKATFFILGTNIEGNEEIIKRMSSLNMEIANHMYSHKLITKLESDTITEEIEKVDKLIYNITGKKTKFLRPSYGTINKRIRKIIDKPIITWNVDPEDWKYHNSKRIANNIIKKASDGDIILLHDIYRATSNSLEIVIPKLLEEGYQFVTVSELLYYKGINPKSGIIYTNVN